jgi:hypothetical protein
MKKYFFVLLISSFSISVFSQPFVDVLNLNMQYFGSTYKDSLRSSNLTQDNNLSAFIPIQFKNGNTFLLRSNGEYIISSISNKIGSSSTSLYALSMPIGFQFVSKNKKWKSLFMAIPKVASDFRGNLSRDSQLGGTALFTYVFNDSLNVKFGLFYNREFFGNFFVPLVGIDWKASSRWRIYGILPNNMRVEYHCGKRFNKFYCGIGFKNYKRSYRLSESFNNDFILVKETEFKIFIDDHAWKQFWVFIDFAYSLKYDFSEYQDLHPKDLGMANQIYSPLKNNFLFTAGLAYRIRTD